MINRYPLWKYLVVLAVILVGVLYALPNVFGEDPAIQITPNRGAAMDQELRGQVVDTLRGRDIPYEEVELEENHLLIRFRETDHQVEAVDWLNDALGVDYTVALNLAPATPQWLRMLNAAPMYLGLDLRGGVHFLMEVDMDAAVTQAEERYRDEFRTNLRDERIRYVGLERDEGGVVVRFRSAEDRDQALQILRREYRDLEFASHDDDDEYTLIASIDDEEKDEIRRLALQQNITSLRNRVDELGVAEPIIQQSGPNRIVVQLPGVQDTARAKEILGATATLEFRLVREDLDPREAVETGRVPPGAALYHERDGGPILLANRVMLTGDHITNASSGFDQDTGSPAVFINLDGRGASIFRRVTGENVGRLMGVIFIESQTTTRIVDGETVREREMVEEVINVARIREQLGRRFQITGLDSSQEARNLALLLRAGALAAPIDIIEERTVGPSLGEENIEQGFRSVVIGFILVLLFMSVYYRVFGLVANLALTTNLVLIIAILSMLQATLTLPGIAGILLTVGMAVDANVLIFERIREEIRNGNTPQASIHSGYEKAFSTIADANITTLIAAIVLFSFGTGPVRGFAVTLSIGILTSMFTALLGTRAVINLLYGGRRVQRLAI